MRIGLLSDTHSWLDPRLLIHFESCDEIWHAGDFGDAQISDQLSSWKRLRGVYGNVDGQELRLMHPAEQVFEVEGLRVYMIHIGGYPGHYPSPVQAGIEKHKPGLFICGHSHICKVMRDNRYHLLHINPGAAGRHGMHKIRTAARFDISEGKVNKLEIIELGLRGATEA